LVDTPHVAIRPLSKATGGASKPFQTGKTSFTACSQPLATISGGSRDFAEQFLLLRTFAARGMRDLPKFKIIVEN